MNLYHQPKDFDTSDAYFAAICSDNNVRQVADGTYEVPASDGTRTYTVTHTGAEEYGDIDLWACTCPARTTCRHIRLIGQLIDEAWA